MEPRHGLFLLCLVLRATADQCGLNQQQRYHHLSYFDDWNMTTPQRISELTSQTQQTCVHACHDNNNCTMFNININDGQCLLYAASFPSVINSDRPTGVRLYARESDTCPIAEGYIAFDNPPACYRMSVDKRSWMSAKTYCEGDEGHLAVLEDVDNWQQVMAVTAGFGEEEPFYIGLDDRDKEGTHRWENGRELLNSSLWAHDEPTPGVSEDCVVMHKRGLSDVSCSRAYYFMCQIDIM